MGNSKQNQLLSKTEIKQAFAGEMSERFPPILTVELVAILLSAAKPTVYEWVQKGRFDGCFRKRGKHLLFWRDKVIDIIFNGKDW